MISSSRNIVSAILLCTSVSACSAVQDVEKYSTDASAIVKDVQTACAKYSGLFNVAAVTGSKTVSDIAGYGTALCTKVNASTVPAAVVDANTPQWLDNLVAMIKSLTPVLTSLI